MADGTVIDAALSVPREVQSGKRPAVLMPAPLIGCFGFSYGAGTSLLPPAGNDPQVRAVAGPAPGETCSPRCLAGLVSKPTDMAYRWMDHHLGGEAGTGATPLRHPRGVHAHGRAAPPHRACDPEAFRSCPYCGFGPFISLLSCSRAPSFMPRT